MNFNRLYLAVSEKVMDKKENRFEIIDLLRGIAILLVVIRHVQIRIPFDKTDFIASLPTEFFSAIFVSGSEGVRIFFVISGFLITMNALRRYSDLQSLDIKQFYKFRFARIMPCLVALLGVLTMLHFLGVKGYVINSKFTYSEAVFSALTFHLNWLEGMKGYLPPNWDVLWSLSVEEVFYLVFPFVCLASRRKEVIYFVLMALIIVGPFNRYLLEGNKIWQAKAYLSCMDSIAIGCLFALMSHNKNITKPFIHAFSIIGTLLVIFVLMVKKDTSFDYLADVYLFKSILSIGVGLLLIASVRQRLSSTLRILLSPLAVYGRSSYEIYLTHSFVVVEGIRLYRAYDVSLNDSFIWLFGIIFVSGVLGYLVEQCFSKPMNEWIRNR